MRQSVEESNFKKLYVLRDESFSVSFVLQAFIADNPHEQQKLMRVILNGSHLAHLLMPYFTPHCVPAAHLLNLYTSLSKSVRDPITSSAALALLSQLDIKNAGDRLAIISLKLNPWKLETKSKCDF